MHLFCYLLCKIIITLSFVKYIILLNNIQRYQDSSYLVCFTIIKIIHIINSYDNIFSPCTFTIDIIQTLICRGYWRSIPSESTFSKPALLTTHFPGRNVFLLRNMDERAKCADTRSAARTRRYYCRDFDSTVA